MSFSFSTASGSISRSQLTGIRVALVIAGLVAVGVGIAILVWPEATLLVVSWLFGIYFLVAGVHRIIRSFTDKDVTRGYRIASGILGALLVIAGIYLLINPVFGVAVLAYTIGFAWVAEGIAALVDRPAATPRWWSIVYGVISIIGGVLIFFIPVTAVVILLKIAAIMLMIAGVIQVIQALMLGRGSARSNPRPAMG